MPAAKIKMWVFSLVLLFTGSLLGWYVLSGPPEAPPDRQKSDQTADYKSPVPWFALKWAQETQLLDPQTRRERLAEVLRLRSGGQKNDPQSRWEKKLKAWAWDLLTTVTRYSGPEEYIEKYVVGRPEVTMRYHCVLAMLGPEQLPQLYDMLNDETYAPHWHKIASIIGMIGNDQTAADVLWDYFQRDDSWNFSINSLASKTYSLAWLGNIGSENYDDILRQAVTLEGAEKLAQYWIDKSQLRELDRTNYRGRDRALKQIRSSALTGLVFTGRPENIDLVRQMFQKEQEIYKAGNEKPEILSSLVDAMACNKYLEDKGKDLLLLQLSDAGPPGDDYFWTCIRNFSWRPKNPDK